MTPDEALPDARHHAECRKRLQELFKTLSIAVYITQIDWTRPPEECLSFLKVLGMP